MTRGQRKRAERRAEIIDNLLGHLCVIGIVAIGVLLTIVLAMFQ